MSTAHDSFPDFTLALKFFFLKLHFTIPSLSFLFITITFYSKEVATSELLTALPFQNTSLPLELIAPLR